MLDKFSPMDTRSAYTATNIHCAITSVRFSEQRELAEFGVASSIVRTPGGAIKPVLTMRLWLRGYPTVLFSFDTHDSMRLEGKWKGPAPDYSRIKGGEIVLMHDDNSLCVSELPSLLESVRSRISSRLQ